MPDAEPNELPIAGPSTIPCRNLRNNGMYIYTDGLGEKPRDDYDSTVYWCLKTMKGFGPDDDFVGGDDCRNPDRSCYEPT